MGDRLTLPGFVDVHSHTFQRALRGRAGGGDFWAWRDSMLAEAERQTPDSDRLDYAAWYHELRLAGYTAVGEFHYLGLQEALAALEAAAEAGIELVVLLAAYARGGLPRFRQESPADFLRQVETLRDRGAHVCLCPTTEANLGDGYAPVEALLERGIPICVGSDSNVRIDPLEELRELEGIARRSSGRRNIVPVEALLSFGSAEGATALGLERWPDVSVDLGHPSLAGVAPADVPAALVFGCSADVFSG